MLVLPVISKALFVRLDCLNSSFLAYICTVFQLLVHVYDRSCSALCLRFCFRLYRFLCNTVLSHIFPLCSVPVQDEAIPHSAMVCCNHVHTSFCFVLYFVQPCLLLCYNFPVCKMRKFLCFTRASSRTWVSCVSREIGTLRKIF